MTGNYLVLGAGGQGKVVADIMKCQMMSVVGYLDDDPSMIGDRVLGLPVLGKITEWMDFKPDGLVAAIGSNTIRRTVVKQLEQATKPPWVTAIHPQATLASTVQVGTGTVIMAGAVINADAKIGNHAIVNTGATVDHDCVLDDFVHIAPGVHLAGNVYVGEAAFLGIGCSVIPGCKIGAFSTIGAGAAVIDDVPSGVVAKGVPARWQE